MKITPQRLLYAVQWSWLYFLIYALVGKTFVTTLRMIIIVILATCLGIILKKNWGISEGAGAIIGILIICAVLWAVLLGRLLLFVPFPFCRKGKCHSIDDYSWFHGTFFGKCKWGVYWYKCHCGDQYLRRGKRFMEFIPEVTVPPSPWVNINKGTTRPYKKLVGFRKWADDAG